jgi:hypothetical protein
MSETSLLVQVLGKPIGARKGQGIFSAPSSANHAQLDEMQSPQPYSSKPTLCMVCKSFLNRPSSEMKARPPLQYEGW